MDLIGVVQLQPRIVGTRIHVGREPLMFLLRTIPGDTYAAARVACGSVRNDALMNRVRQGGVTVRSTVSLISTLR